MSDPLLIDYIERYPAEVAALLAPHDASEVLATLRELPVGAIVKVLPVLPGGLLQRLVASAGDALVALWLDAASFDAVVAVLVRLRPERRGALIELLESHRRRVDLSHRFAWPDGVLGALTARNFVSMPMGATLRDLVTELLRHDDAVEDEPRIYVLDAAGRMRGEVDMYRALEAEDRDQSLLRYLSRVETLPADMPLATAIDASVWQRSTVVPIVDRDRRPIGTVTLAAIRDGLQGVEAGEAAFETVADLATRFLEVLGGLAGVAFGGASPGAEARRASRAQGATPERQP